jgi:hypothetical protein
MRKDLTLCVDEYPQKKDTSTLGITGGCEREPPMDWVRDLSLFPVSNLHPWYIPVTMTISVCIYQGVMIWSMYNCMGGEQFPLPTCPSDIPYVCNTCIF